MTRWLTLALLACVGCNRDDVPDTGDPDSDDDTDFEDVDPLDGLDRHEECESFEDGGVEYFIPGATSYFVGDFRLVGDEDVEGYEYWVLLANEAWQETGDVDEECVITWEIYGVQGDPVRCGSCDLSIAFDAYVVEEMTDCPRGLWEPEEQFSVTYDVRLSGDESQVYFTGSGDQLGEGEVMGDQFTYVTTWACKWF